MTTSQAPHAPPPTLFRFNLSLLALSLTRNCRPPSAVPHFIHCTPLHVRAVWVACPAGGGYYSHGDGISFGAAMEPPAATPPEPEPASSPEPGVPRAEPAASSSPELALTLAPTSRERQVTISAATTEEDEEEEEGAPSDSSPGGGVGDHFPPYPAPALRHGGRPVLWWPGAQQNDVE